MDQIWRPTKNTVTEIGGNFGESHDIIKRSKLQYQYYFVIFGLSKIDGNEKLYII